MISQWAKYAGGYLIGGSINNLTVEFSIIMFIFLLLYGITQALSVCVWEGCFYVCQQQKTRRRRQKDPR